MSVGLQDEPRFRLPIFLTEYPGRNKLQTHHVLEELRSCVCIAMTVRNEGVIFVNDHQPFTLHKGGDYTTIRIMIKKGEPLSNIQLLALQELCSVARKLQISKLLSFYADALESTLVEIWGLH